MDAPAPFPVRLAAAVEQRASSLVLGIDPHPDRLWPQALAAAPATGEVRARLAVATVAHCTALISAAGHACVAVKLQLACFERLGAPGWTALGQVVAHARERGLLVIADAKRGDIDVSAAAYAEALFGPAQTPLGRLDGLGADAITVNPLLGLDALAPFTAAAAAAGGGVFVLVRTSNPGAADLQDAELADGRPLWERIAELVDAAARAAGPDAGLSLVGAVAGATAPEHLARMRELMPRSVFLLPGIGAQGGRVADLAPAFAPGPAAGLVTASRAISDAPGDPAKAAAAAAERLRAQTWALASRR